MLVALILACELAFWAVLLAGLFVRYPLGRPRLGAILLAVTPVIDVVLLAAAVVDLRRGGEAAMRHALAAIYLGCSIAFGSRIIAWADGEFAHRFAGGPNRQEVRDSAPTMRGRSGTAGIGTSWPGPSRRSCSASCT